MGPTCTRRSNITPMSVREHWQKVYATSPSHQLSWYQPSPVRSLQLIRRLQLPRDARIIDVGGGVSTLVDALLADGYRNLAVLDIAEESLEQSRRRLEEASARVNWIAADITKFNPDEPWDLWHDRAVFHFLVDEAQRAGYRMAFDAGLRAGGHAVMATFGLAGPPQCSGLPVQRYDPAALRDALANDLELVSESDEVHLTPGGAKQQFLYCTFRRQARNPRSTL